VVENSGFSYDTIRYRTIIYGKPTKSRLSNVIRPQMAIILDLCVMLISLPGCIVQSIFCRLDNFNLRGAHGMEGRLDYQTSEFKGGEAVFQCLRGVIYSNLLSGINRVRC